MTSKHDRLTRAGQLLSSYVSYGKLDIDDQFDDVFSELAQIVPASCRPKASHAFRVIELSPDDDAKLTSVGALVLRPRKFGSWTKDEKAAHLLLRNRCLRAQPDNILLVVRKFVPADCGVVDVEKLYRRLGWDCGEVEEWSRYASWERELILCQDETMLRIEMSDVLGRHHPKDPMVLMPRKGELVWSNAAEDYVRIQAVEIVQPLAEDGSWNVRTDCGHLAVRWDVRNDAWEEADIPAPAVRP